MVLAKNDADGTLQDAEREAVKDHDAEVSDDIPGLESPQFGKVPNDEMDRFYEDAKNANDDADKGGEVVD